MGEVSDKTDAAVYIFRQMQERLGNGCHDRACVIKRTTGQVTNGGCGCLEDMSLMQRQYVGAMLRAAQDMADALEARPEAAQVWEEDLDERMKAAGMIPLSELLESHGPMEKFKQHAAVKTFDDFVWWVKSQQKQFMTMRMRYELGDKDKGDDLFEWVFAHAAVYDQITTQLRALEPDTVTGWQDISTAPKDGTWFLGYTPRRVHGWPWQNSKGAILSFRWWGKGKGDRIPWFSNMDGFPQPTHWMPLPPAPEKEG